MLRCIYLRVKLRTPPPALECRERLNLAALAPREHGKPLRQRRDILGMMLVCQHGGVETV
jgi:hypothetical protein